MRCILVTGSQGFLATHVIAELRRRFPAARITPTHRSSWPGITRCNLSDPEETRRVIARAKPELVFHLAGSVKPIGWERLWRAHVDATYHLMEALSALPNPSKSTVVIAGSSAEYGPPSSEHGSRPIVEAMPCRPSTEYGRTKYCQTLTALSHRPRGIRVVIARIFNALGPNMPEQLSLGSFAAQIARLEAGRAPARIQVGRLTTERDFVDVRDAARALVLLALRGVDGEIYNVCSGVASPIGGLLRDMIALSRRPISVVQRRDIVRKIDIKTIRGSHRKLTAATGWRPRMPIRQSLRDTLESRRALLRAA